MILFNKMTEMTNRYKTAENAIKRQNITPRLF